jgi:hypothetical protein
VTTLSKWVKAQPTPNETMYINIETISQITFRSVLRPGSCTSAGPIGH